MAGFGLWVQGAGILLRMVRMCISLLGMCLQAPNNSGGELEWEPVVLLRELSSVVVLASPRPHRQLVLRRRLLYCEAQILQT